jgi:phosphatidate phosphatase APP1
MSRLKVRTLFLLYSFKRLFSAVRLWIWKKLGLIRSVLIMPYLGLGNEKEFFFPGRVLSDRGIGLSKMDDSKWKNFKKMYKRFGSIEIPNVKLKATFGNISQIATTDEEGYFEFHFKLPKPISISTPWQVIKLELIEQILNKQKSPVVDLNRIYVSTDKVRFGVISDIDDTIVPTGTARLWEMIKTTLFGNAHSRIPFPGVSAFYQALAKGPTGVENNPFFYVSSSPWNLYDFLMEFLEIHGIPQGPLMLRDIGLSRKYFISGSHSDHKITQLERILGITGKMQFILIGDSKQHDAEIYRQIISDFPGRVKMVYIRDDDEERNPVLMKIADEIIKSGVEFLFVSNTSEASMHASSKGWITHVNVQVAATQNKSI